MTPSGTTDSPAVAASNHLLEYQPAFTYSMPAQVLVHGVVLTLLSVLTVHLLFTARYHYPLARVNFILLLSTVLLALGCIAASVAIVNKRLLAKSRTPPFMFDYVEVVMPPESWGTVPLAGYYIFNMLITLLTHVTHIQFLTLLFPSALERKLIILFLVPLALLSSALYFTKFFSNSDFIDLGDAIRNTANSTLTLLYTAGLIIWGAVVNRKRAWDTEGGTAGFGILAVSLAIMGTATNFVEVKEERMIWLNWIVWTVLLWQSWTGFWWWVGSGMWGGEVEDHEKREQKRRRREAKKRKHRERRLNELVAERSTTALQQEDQVLSEEEEVRATSTATRLRDAVGLVSRRLQRRNPVNAEGSQGPNIELGVMSPRHRNEGGSEEAQDTHTLHESNQHEVTSNVGGHVVAVATDPSSTTLSYSTFTNRIVTFFTRPQFVQRWIVKITTAHNEAAKQQASVAVERVETENVKRWGIGAMKRRVERNRQGNQLRDDSNRRRRRGDADEDGWESDSSVTTSSTSTTTTSRIGTLDGQESTGSEEVDDTSRRRRRQRRRSSRSRPNESGFGDPPNSSEQRSSRRQRDQVEDVVEQEQQQEGETSAQAGQYGHRGWTWTGGLARARLRDVTTYD